MERTTEFDEQQEEAMKARTRREIETAAENFRRSPRWIDRYFDLWSRYDVGPQPFIESALLQWRDDTKHLLAILYSLSETIMPGGPATEEAALFLQGLHQCMEILFQEHTDLVELGTHLLPYDPMVRERIAQVQTQASTAGSLRAL